MFGLSKDKITLDSSQWKAPFEFATWSMDYPAHEKNLDFAGGLSSQTRAHHTISLGRWHAFRASGLTAADELELSQVLRNLQALDDGRPYMRRCQ